MFLAAPAYDSPRWVLVVADPVYAEVRDRDHHRCRLCGSTQLLEVHHILYRSHGGPDEAWNLVTLCKQHHMQAHGTAQPRLKRDHLHAMVEMGYFGGDRSIRTCRTCLNRDADFVCTLTEEQMLPTDACTNWEAV